MKKLLILFLLFTTCSLSSVYAGMCEDFAGAQLISPDGTFLGYLDSNKYNSNGIANTYGDYGSKYEDKSIFNRYGTYGSRYEDTSPWNRYAQKPPMIKKGGTVMGTLTLNRYAEGAQNTFDILYCFIEPSDERLTPFAGLNPGRSSKSYRLPGSSTSSSSIMTETQSCQFEFGIYATAGDSAGYCKCMPGYKWNSERTACIAMTADERCQSQYGAYSYSPQDGKCGCKNGYEWNSSRTSCVIAMTEDQKCQSQYGNYSYSPQAGYCNCINGYQRSSDRSYCVKTPTTTTTTTTNYTVTPAATSSNTTVNCDTYGPNAYSVNNKCECKDTYEWNYSKNYCVAARNHPLYYGTDFRSAKDGGDYINMLLDFEDTVNACTSEFGINSYEGSDKLCYCKDGYARNKEKTSCVSLTESCISYFGKHSVGDPTNSDNCLCESGYVFNSDNTECIESNGVNNSSYSNNYSTEFNNAYQFAFNNKITTMPSIEEANMNGEIIRAEIAKMLANWVKSLGRTPDTSKSCSFKDISGVQGDLNTAIIEACQLGIMGQGITEFRPFDKITKGEVSTAVSRIIRGNKNDGGDPFYWKHMNALKDAGVIPDLSNPEINEIRGNVMVTLMKASGTEELLSCDDPAVILACSLDDPSCPNKCLEK